MIRFKGLSSDFGATRRGKSGEGISGLLTSQRRANSPIKKVLIPLGLRRPRSRQNDAEELLLSSTKTTHNIKCHIW